MEIFIYLHISKSSEGLVVYPLDNNVENLRVKFQNFKAARARCHFDSDRQHLLAVIEASFGDLEPFDRLIHGILSERLSPQVRV